MIPLLPSLDLARRRRARLQAQLDIRRQLEALEESCVPSYCHPNPLAAAVAWWRLFAVRSLYERFRMPGPLLDFGAATGELFHVLAPADDYHFVEESELLARVLLRSAPAARRERIDALPPARFGSIFALDSLEHNEDAGALVDALVGALAPGGRLYLSGPTESGLYRLGRRIAGFEGHYHHMTVFDVERVLARRLRRLTNRNVPPAPVLFRVSVWSAARPDRP